MTFVPRLWQSATGLQDRPIYSGPIFERRPERNLVSFKMPANQDPYFHFSVPQVVDVPVDQKKWPKSVAQQKRPRKFNVKLHAELTKQQQIVRQKILDGNRRRREEKEAVEEEAVEEECCICLDRPAVTKLLPCRHKCVCATCSAKVDQCPLCRHAIVAHAEN